jgi:hypothetical protein
MRFDPLPGGNRLAMRINPRHKGFTGSEHAASLEPPPIMPHLTCGYCTNGKVSFSTSIADGKCFRCNGKGTRFISQDDLDMIEEANAAEIAGRAAAEANRMTVEQGARISKAAMLFGVSFHRLMKLALGISPDLCVIEQDETRANADLTIAFAIALYRMKPADRKRALHPAIMKVAA